jgi:lycopene beta-cyclase
MADVFDLVILGGGCAGLSLSMALEAHGGRTPRTLVVESRTEYWNDRTWCYWSDRSTLVPYQVQHRWQTMRVSHGEQSVSLDCGSTPYHMLAAEYFYAAALASIDRQPNIAMWSGTSVLSEPEHKAGLWTILTSAGQVTARAVVDTRPPQLARRDGATLWQSFYGLEIECSSAVFDPLSIDLMKFLEPDPRHVPFVYVLPVTSTRALVELTVFGATPLGPRELSEQLDAEVAKLLGDSPFTTLRSEHGILPMGLNETLQSEHKSYARVGVMAGGARPSTGYAFQRIQRWASECAFSLASQGHPMRHRPDPLPLRVMDRIFLDVLRADPVRGGAIFFSLFSGADPARVIRFLSGRGSAVDSLAVVAAVPFAPFLRAAFAMIWRGARLGAVEKANRTPRLLDE